MLFHGFHFSVHIKPIPGVPHLFLLFPQLHLVAPLLFFCVLSSINSSHRGLRGTLHRQKTFPLRSACEDGRCAFGNRKKNKKYTTCFVPNSDAVLTVPIKRLPGGKLALAGCRVAGGRSRGLAAASRRVYATSIPHLLLLLFVVFLQVLLLLGASEVGHIAGQGRRT